jgi:hypothetical protein
MAKNLIDGLISGFDGLARLEDGWLDGEGLAPDRGRLAAFAGRFTRICRRLDGMPLPAVVPTPEGNVLIEWTAPGLPSLDVDLASMAASFHAFDPGFPDIEAAFDLTREDGFRALARRLAIHFSLDGKQDPR